MPRSGPDADEVELVLLTQRHRAIAVLQLRVIRAARRGTNTSWDVRAFRTSELSQGWAALKHPRG
jgi:hypothetical protein